MKKWCFIILFVLFRGYVYPQSVDELLSAASELHNSNPDSSFELCVIAEEQAIQMGDEVREGFSILCRVRFLLLKNKLEECSKELEKATDIFRRNNSQLGLAKTYLVMSNIAGRIKKDENEIEYLERSNTIFKELNDTVGLLKTYTNLALNYIHYGLLDKGEKALKELEKISQGMPIKEYYYLNQNWGIFYVNKGNYASAHRRFEAAKKIAKSEKMIDSQATIMYLIADVYFKEQNFTLALESILASLKIAEEHDLVIEELEALEMLNRIYEGHGDTKKAYNTFKRIVAIKDTIYNLKRINKLNEYQKEIELSEKQSIISQQELAIEKHKSQLLQDKYQLYFLGAILFIVLVSIVFLIINLKSKKKANKIISKQKEEVEEQKKLVELKNQEILSSITYAKRIQEAILPQDKVVKEYLQNSFILYRPKDIVSGDFYWMEQIDDKNIICSCGLYRAWSTRSIYEYRRK